MKLDCLLIIPFEPASAAINDPAYRKSSGAYMSLPFAIATNEFEQYLGRSINYWESGKRPLFGGKPMPLPLHRSLTAMVLSSSLEHAGLKWRAIDPGNKGLHYWRGKLREQRSVAPYAVALSTTFVMTSPWLHALCAIVRDTLPDTKLLVGGYYYATNVKRFLSLDADVFCIGEGEIRLPGIIKSIREGDNLCKIPGLYVRSEDGTLHYTGQAEPLDLAVLPPIDWKLASQIDPSVDLKEDTIEFGVETQRGCVFKCEFCSYRTLVTPRALNPREAVDVILNTAGSRQGALNIVDSTATFPHKRWEDMMRLLIQRGGSPYPMWAFARVSDVTNDLAALMAKAGVRYLFIGQESGDQRILNAMKKGTRVDQVKPAIHALGQHKIGATFGFIHGFPGEDTESIMATRAMIASLNDGFESNPVVYTYLLYPFIYLDFSSISRHSAMRGVDHYLGYESSSFSPQRAVEEVLNTIIAISRIPHAPSFSFLLLKSVLPTSGITLFTSPHRIDIFRWLKAVERGTAIFLERELEGRPINDTELRHVRDEVLRRFPPLPPQKGISRTCAFMVQRLILHRLRREWLYEKNKGPGMLTRSLFALSALQETGNWSIARRMWKFGSLEPEVSCSVQNDESAKDALHSYAEELVSQALATRKKYSSDITQDKGEISL